MNTYKVKSENEAYELVKSHLQTGKYDLFRGQAKDWPVLSTIVRLSKTQYEQELEKLDRLFYFFQTTPSLSKYSIDDIWFHAVAQHYGIATNLIDFSSDIDVAFYFATHSKECKQNSECVILCLNRQDFIEEMKLLDSMNLFEGNEMPQIIDIDVHNLWRLQAQKGCFLFAPYSNFDSIYTFDKIVFPFNKPYDKLSSKDIYPERKSELELLLDQYFHGESRIKNHKAMQPIFSMMEKMELPDVDYMKYVRKSEVHESWKGDDTKYWNHPLTEEWVENSFEKNIILTLDSTAVNITSDNILDEFKSQQITKQTPINFNFKFVHSLKDDKLTKKINQGCCRIWDGSRNLPFTLEEISQMILAFIKLLIMEHNNQIDKFHSNNIYVDLVSFYGVHSKCSIEALKIAEAFRDDINDILIEELTPGIKSEVLLYVNKPGLVFDFNKLTKLFISDFVPYQMFRNIDEKSATIIFTPMLLDKLGYS